MKSIITASIWILFLKGFVAVGITIYTGIKELIDIGKVSMIPIAGCAVGSFAFILACLAVWIRQKVQ